jgi:hypothetical protein
MATIAMTGNDVIVINNRNIRDVGVGNVAELTFPNEVASLKTGKNGNAIYSINYSGLVVDLKLMVLRGSSDDVFLSSLYAQQMLNFAGFPLMIGQFVKKIGDGQGNVSLDTYILSGGIFVKGQEAKTNTDGEAEQSQTTYTFKFSNAPRTLT